MAKALKIDGLDEVTKTLVDISPAEGKRIARRTVTRIAREVRDEVRSHAPVDEGDLKKAIKSRRTKGARGKASAEVWVDRSGGRTGRGYHWHLVEFGTGPRTVKSTGTRVGAMPAQPFVTPTVEEFRPRIPGAYKRLWWPEYEKEMVKRAKKQRGRK